MEATLGLTRPFSYGGGFSRLVSLPNPAAGKLASFVVPGNRTVRLLTAKATLTASAQVATRTPQLKIADPDGNAIAVFGPAGSVLKETAQTTTYAVGLGYEHTVAVSDAQVGIPDLMLLTGMQVVLDVGSIQTEDRLSALALYVEEYPNGPDGYPIAAWRPGEPV